MSQARQANELLQHFNFADEENLYLIGQAAPLLFVALAAVQKEEWFEEWTTVDFTHSAAFGARVLSKARGRNTKKKGTGKFVFGDGG